LESLYEKCVIYNPAEGLAAIIKHLARFDIRDPEALIDHFWSRIHCGPFHSAEKESDMCLIYRLFILVELKLNLKRYSDFSDVEGFPLDNPIMIELGRSCLSGRMPKEE